MSQTRSNVRSPRRDGVAVARAAVLTHGRAEVIGDAPDRLRAVAARCGVEIVGEDDPDIVVVLGGDGTIRGGRFSDGSARASRPLNQAG